MYDEDDSIQYIRAKLGDMLAPYDDDQLLNVIDMVWDWQDRHGYLDIDGECDDDIPVDTLVADIQRLLARDRRNLLPPEVAAEVARAELEYEDTL